ncbi:MAG TPA: hypothetical protein VG942_17795 [Hyphomonadaceae bacterium]|nr:hypothetical protein [Hyphomonadaceae bacterium]
MLGVALFLLFQTPSADPPPTDPAPVAAETVAAAPETPAKPKMICKKETMTGTHAKKIIVCRTDEYVKQANRQRDNFSLMLNGSGNIAPPPPRTPGG